MRYVAFLVNKCPGVGIAGRGPVKAGSLPPVQTSSDSMMTWKRL